MPGATLAVAAQAVKPSGVPTVDGGAEATAVTVCDRIRGGPYEERSSSTHDLSGRGRAGPIAIR